MVLFFVGNLYLRIYVRILSDILINLTAPFPVREKSSLQRQSDDRNSKVGIRSNVFVQFVVRFLQVVMSTRKNFGALINNGPDSQTAQNI